MAESPQTPPGGAPADQANPPRLTVVSQYVKDLSFENPRAPRSLQPGEARPEIQIRVDVRAQQLEAERYEVSLQLHAEAKSGEETAFMVELTYAGLFGLLNIPQESLQPLLLIECPRLLVPVRPSGGGRCHPRWRLSAAADRSDRFRDAVPPPPAARPRRRARRRATVANPVVGDGASN